MPATNSAIEATKRNRAMMRKPSLFKNMSRYHKKPRANLTDHEVMSVEERNIFDERMKAAKMKGLKKEIKLYVFSTLIGFGGFYMIYQFLF